MKRPKQKKIYALYHGDEYLCNGTLDEIAENRHVRVRTLKQMLTTTYAIRLKNALHGDDWMRLIEIPEGD